MAFQFPPNPTLGQQFAPVTGTTYEWNGTGWIFLGLNTASLYPAGIVLPYAGAAPLPFQGWLICDGANYARTAQPALFAVIGTTYGSTSATDFRVPDLRGRVVAGPDASALMGPAGRLTGGTLSAGLGAESVTLTAAQAPSHAHGITDVAHAHGVNDPTHAHAVYDPSHAHGNTLNDPGHAHTYVETSQNPPGNNFATGGTGPGQIWKDNSTSFSSLTGISVSIHAAGTGIGIYGAGTGIGIQASGTGLSATQAAGGGAAHANVQPTIVLNYIIKT